MQKLKLKTGGSITYMGEVITGVINGKLRDFIKLHFGPMDNLYSYIIFGCRDPKVLKIQNKKVKFGVYNCRYLKSTEIDSSPVIDDLQYFCNDKKDYYITQNGFTSPIKRDVAHLFTLYNMVIDIDCHDTKNFSTHSLDAFEYFLYDLFDEPGFTPPNTIVKTGRGFQLWWAINPVSYKLRYMYDDIRSDFVHKIEEMIKDIPSLEYMHVDKAASSNYAGFFRLPGSYNSKSGTWGTYDIISDTKLNLVETYLEKHSSPDKKNVEKIVFKKKGKKQTKNKKKNKTSNILRIREIMLHKLLELRNGKNDVGYRDLMIFILYNAYLSTGKSEIEAWEAIMKLNNKFSEPLPEHEIATSMKTSNRKKYKISNKKIIEMLGMTKYECECLNFHESSGRETERKKKRDTKKMRNEKIEELLKSGMTQTAVAKETGCSKSTVCRLAKKLNIASVNEDADTGENTKKHKVKPKKTKAKTGKTVSKIKKPDSHKRIRSKFKTKEIAV